MKCTYLLLLNKAIFYLQLCFAIEAFNSYYFFYIWRGGGEAFCELSMKNVNLFWCSV